MLTCDQILLLVGVKNLLLQLLGVFLILSLTILSDLLLCVVLVVVVALGHLFVLKWYAGDGGDQLVPFRLFTHLILHRASWHNLCSWQAH